MAPFLGWGSTVSRLQSNFEEAFYFLPLFPRFSSIHLIDLVRLKGCVKLGAIQWFLIWDPWTGNPVP